MWSRDYGTAESVSTEYGKMALKKLCHLAIPKGLCPRCELCGQPARYQCARCKEANYCCPEHYDIEREFHPLICAKLLKLREFHVRHDPDGPTAEQARRQNLRRRRELMTWSAEVAALNKEEGNYDIAIAAARSTVKMASGLPVKDIVETQIQPLLIAAECHVHKGEPTEAGTYLSRAQNLEDENETLAPSVKAQIRHNEGLIAMASYHLEDARNCFAEEVYQKSKAYGPSDYRTSPGFYCLGQVFHLMEENNIAASFIRQCVAIWIDKTDQILEEERSSSHRLAVAGRFVPIAGMTWMDTYEILFGMKVLRQCHDLALELGKAATAIDLGTSCYAIASVAYIGERYNESRKWLRDGLEHLHPDKEEEHGILTKLANLLKENLRRRGNRRKSSHGRSRSSFVECMADFL